MLVNGATVCDQVIQCTEFHNFHLLHLDERSSVSLTNIVTFYELAGYKSLPDDYDLLEATMTGSQQ